MTDLTSLLKRWEELPRIEDTGPKSGVNAPVMLAIRRRLRLLYGAMCLLGLLPAVLYLSGLPLPYRAAACALGMVVPGGGLLAGGSLPLVLGGAAVLAAFFTLGRSMVDWYGNIAVMLLLTAAGCLGGLFASPGQGAVSMLPPVLAAAACVIYFEGTQRRLERRILADRQRRIESFPRLEALVSALPEPPAQERRELDDIALKAARYLFDMTVRERGDFQDYNKTRINSMGAYRYQFSALGYALMLMQCKYTPNFRGYQSRAWHFLADAFTDPRCCAYWKWEKLGGRFRWDPDPVAKENIMLSGWMLPVVNACGANMGDRSYEREGSIAFRPFFHRDTQYSYSAHSLTDTLAGQWLRRDYPGLLVPCEPHIAFPVCNSYGIMGTMIYDRDHGTDYSLRILDAFNEKLSEEFEEADGCVTAMRHYLFGACRYLLKPAMNVSVLNGLSIAWEYAPIYPGLARRCYAMARDELIEIRNGMAQLRNMPWEQIVDPGTMSKNPSLFCGLLEHMAAEHGDWELMQALEAVERVYLKPSSNPGVLKYKDVSVVNMAYIALGKWARQGDWRDTILLGPGENALRGPYLDDCSYPDVLVARAVSTDGEDLDLVLCSGSRQKRQSITIRRLQPQAEYIAQGPGLSFRAGADGSAVLDLELGDRTGVYIRRV